MYLKKKKKKAMEDNCKIGTVIISLSLGTYFHPTTICPAV